MSQSDKTSHPVNDEISCKGATDTPSFDVKWGKMGCQEDGPFMAGKTRFFAEKIASCRAV
jgi:hypothetical protein